MSKLYPCVNCTEDGYCKKYSDAEVKSWCVQGPCKDERPSNADRIRNMTDEELAKLFSHIAYCSDCPIDRQCPINAEQCQGNRSKCYLAWLEWLKSEA